MKNRNNIRWLALLSLALTSCIGSDRELLYFPPSPAESKAPTPATDENVSGRECVLSYSSQLCVAIKGDNIDVGTKEGEKLCAEVPPFPLRITSGTTITMKGSEFPNIDVEGHGLPIPITINGKGEGTGESNIASGTIDAAGNITMEGFSFFINVLGEAAEIPNLTLTTGQAQELPHLPSLAGSPPDASGAMDLAIGTILGSIFPAADKFLKGASLSAIFSGSINPALDECTGTQGERTIEATRITIDEQGVEHASPLPGGNRFEISEGTYIAQESSHVGPRFEATKRFRVKNIGRRVASIRLSPKIGSFYLESLEPLTRELNPQQFFTLDITFRPKAGQVKAGEVVESVVIGSELFQLVARALDPSGETSIDTIEEDGTVAKPNTERIDIGEVSVSTNTQRDFFQCKTVTCHENKAFTDCQACRDPSIKQCELLPISTKGRPLGEVDTSCNPLDPEAVPLLAIDLKGTAAIPLSGGRALLAIRNSGVTDLMIQKIAIEEVKESKSKGQFKIPDSAIFVADHFEKIQQQVNAALEGGRAQGNNPPIILPPYKKGFQETTAYIIVSYHPNDLVGYDGSAAGVGSRATDRAYVKIITDGKPIVATISGSTTILEVPALELYFKTSTGLRQIEDHQIFPFRGVTAKTTDVAFPLFLRLADAATAAMRITSIDIEGKDAASFQWLNTRDKIEAVKPLAGEGMRCSIPRIDPGTGNMIDEIFDLNPVSISPPGYDIAPGAFTIESMPLFGCVNFHLEPGAATTSLFESQLVIGALELDEAGNQRRNPDGTPRQTKLRTRLMAAIDPLKGGVVLRVSQAMAVILNQEFPGISSVAAANVYYDAIEKGTGKKSDLQIFTIPVLLDPFDSETFIDRANEKVLTTPGDGITALMLEIDTHPVSTAYDNEFLYDYSYLSFDGSRPEGSRGIFEGFPNVPEGAQTNGLRIFSSGLSFPGPLQPPERRPQWPSQCEAINPCTREGLKLFSDASVRPGQKGACGFFYATAARYDSPSFHTADELDGGNRAPLCDAVDQKQNLLPANTGQYTLDGHVTVEQLGLRLFGPTYFHNPYGPLGSVPPMDIVMQTAFTTEIIKPQSSPNDPDVIPDPRIDRSKQIYKINLTDPTHANPQMCSQNTNNALFFGRRHSTWKYLRPLLSKDEEGKIPAGCPEEDNDFKGGTAFLHGRPLDPETGVITLVAAMHTDASNDLTFALKDIQMFLVLNGWMCDPLGREEDFQGSRCYDTEFNDRDAVDQISIIDD